MFDIRSKDWIKQQHEKVADNAVAQKNSSSAPIGPTRSPSLNSSESDTGSMSGLTRTLGG